MEPAAPDPDPFKEMMGENAMSSRRTVLSSKSTEDIRANYKPGPLLGRGAYGMVLGCVHVKTGKKCEEGGGGDWCRHMRGADGTLFARILIGCAR